MPTEARGWLEEYALWHAAVMGNATAMASAQFVVARHFPTSGLGNMLQSLVSSFLLAVLTQRIFLHDSLFMTHLLRFPRLRHVDYRHVHAQLGVTHVAVNAQYVVYQGEGWMLCDDAAAHLTQQVCHSRPSSAPHKAAMERVNQSGLVNCFEPKHRFPG
jgi:hypothetical protein